MNEKSLSQHLNCDQKHKRLYGNEKSSGRRKEEKRGAQVKQPPKKPFQNFLKTKPRTKRKIVSKSVIHTLALVGYQPPQGFPKRLTVATFLSTFHSCLTGKRKSRPQRRKDSIVTLPPAVLALLPRVRPFTPLMR